MERSVEEVVSRIESKIFMLMLEMLPDPSCPRKKQQNEWKKDQVKKMLSQRLSNQGLGITVKVEI
jgi:DNA-binding HxlR family transcriptional regulator